MINSNTTVVEVTTHTGTPDEMPSDARFVLSIAPKDHVDGATHCLYLPLTSGGFQPEVGGTIQLSPDNGFLQSFDIIQIDQAPGGLAHRAVWLKART